MALLLAASAFPALAAGPSVSFLGADFISGKGLVLYFDVPADFDLSQADSFVVVDGITYPLNCLFNDGGILVCIAAVKKTAIGMTALIVFGGSSFETLVPEANVRPVVIASACTGYTYSVYDYDLGFTWHEIGTHDQSCPALVGDAIPFFQP